MTTLSAFFCIDIPLGFRRLEIHYIACWNCVKTNKRQGNLLLWIFPAAKVIVLYLKGYATTYVERNERADRMCRFPKGIRAMPKVLFSSSTK